jgi:ribosomal protein L11 methyltransferase
VVLDKLMVLTDAAGALLLESRLGAIEINPPLALSRFLAGGDWQVEALFAAPFEEARLAALLDGVAVAAPPIVAPVADRNWVAQVEATLKPIAAGPFLVHGPHDRAAAAGHAFAIEIEAGGAFGTAHHATTQGCLVALAEAVTPSTAAAGGDPARMPGCRRILDLGTGSGVLAIAAAKLDPDAVIFATDIDPEACRIAEENAVLNRVGDRLRVILADGLSHRELSSPGAFDLILANILAEPLVALAPGLRRALAPAGTIILSGLLETQHSIVLAAYQREGLRQVAEWPIEGWVTLALQ